MYRLRSIILAFLILFHVAMGYILPSTLENSGNDSLILNRTHVSDDYTKYSYLITTYL